MNTKSVTAIIADDEPLLRHHLNKSLGECWPQLEIIALATNGEEALSLIELHQPDIIFLDIKMPQQDGMSAAKFIAKKYSKTRVVFITAYDEYAVQAFETNAVDYLLKPVSDARLTQCIEKLQSQMVDSQTSMNQNMTSLIDHIQQLTNKERPSYLTWIKAIKGDDIHLISISEVLYFKAEDKYISLYKQEGSKNSEYLLRTSLKKLLVRLDPDMFWQIHRSCVVNISAIEKVKKATGGRIVVEIKGTQLCVSRAMRWLFTDI